MAKKAYKVEGRFYVKNAWYPFKKEIVSSSKPKAKEKVLSIIGSNHRVKRKKVEIKEVKELAPEEVEDPVVKYLIEK